MYFLALGEGRFYLRDNILLERLHKFFCQNAEIRKEYLTFYYFMLYFAHKRRGGHVTIFCNRGSCFVIQSMGRKPARQRRNK